MCFNWAHKSAWRVARVRFDQSIWSITLAIRFDQSLWLLWPLANLAIKMMKSNEGKWNQKTVPFAQSVRETSSFKTFQSPVFRMLVHCLTCFKLGKQRDLQEALWLSVWLSIFREWEILQSACKLPCNLNRQMTSAFPVKSRFVYFLPGIEFQLEFSSVCQFLILN